MAHFWVYSALRWVFWISHRSISQVIYKPRVNFFAVWGHNSSASLPSGGFPTYLVRTTTPLRPPKTVNHVRDHDIHVGALHQEVKLIAKPAKKISRRILLYLCTAHFWSRIRLLRNLIDVSQSHHRTNLLRICKSRSKFSATISVSRMTSLF